MGWKVETKGEYPEDWTEIATAVKDAANWHCIRCKHKHCIETHHVLTVHHLDGDKSNCRWWNLLALCQRCHLSIQGRVNPDQPYFLDHSEWFKPYAAGFYAAKYVGEWDLSRKEVIELMEGLLDLERLA